MAEPIRNYTPQRNVHQELRAEVENAPVQHAEAVLAAYHLLQEAQDHGVLDTLRGAIGAGDALVGKAAEYASSPESVRAMRNFLALSRVFANLDPARVDAVASALTQSYSERRSQQREPPSLWQILQRVAGRDSRRTLATLVKVTEALGKEPAISEAGPSSGRGNRGLPASTLLPLVAVGLAAVAGFWMGRRT
jgi:uncharacterized protein YjgD (DUF1641 family)